MRGGFGSNPASCHPGTHPKRSPAPGGASESHPKLFLAKATRGKPVGALLHNQVTVGIYRDLVGIAPGEIRCALVNAFDHAPNRILTDLSGSVVELTGRRQNTEPHTTSSHTGRRHVELPVVDQMAVAGWCAECQVCDFDTLFDRDDFAQAVDLYLILYLEFGALYAVAGDGRRADQHGQTSHDCQ